MSDSDSDLNTDFKFTSTFNNLLRSSLLLAKKNICNHVLRCSNRFYPLMIMMLATFWCFNSLGRMPIFNTCANSNQNGQFCESANSEVQNDPNVHFTRAGDLNTHPQRSIEPWNCSKKIDSYRNHPQTTALISFMQSRYRGTGYGGRCYAGVQDGLHMSGYVPMMYKKSIGVAAVNAESHLRAKGIGFINLLNEPECVGKINRAEDAPRGSLLVFEDLCHSRPDPSNFGYCNSEKIWCGHIEVKTEDGPTGQYIGDRTNSFPVSARSCWNLIGVLIRPMN